MDHRLLAAAAMLAAFALPSAPAAAQHSGGYGMHGSRSPRFVDGSSATRDLGGCRAFRDGRHHARADGHSRCEGFAGAFAYDDGQWARYNNRSWDPDSYNDWWNDRPDRAYPRWVQEQRMRGTCDPDRMWWSGSGWHC
jgi:hypothetical protein